MFIIASKEENSVDADKSMYNAHNISAVSSTVDNHGNTSGENEV